MRKWKVSLLVVLLLCAGCTSKDVGEVYVDIDAARQEIEQNRLEITMTGYEYDCRPYNIMKMGVTIDERYLYANFETKMQVDLASGRVKVWCTVPGCIHGLNSKGCEARSGGALCAVGNQMFYVVRGDSLYFRDATGKETLLFENTYCTEYEKNTFPDSAYNLGTPVSRGNSLYLCATTFFYIYDFAEDTISEPILLGNGDSGCLSFAVTDSYAYSVNFDNELFACDLTTKKSAKLEDRVAQVMTVEDTLYYVQWKGAIPYLYAWKEGKNEPTLLLEDCYVNMYVDEKLYCQKWTGDRRCYVADIDGSNIVEFDLSDAEVETAYKIFSHPTADSVFFIGENSIYILNKETLEVRELYVEE